MDAVMTIDVWGDVVCPFCYLGKKQLERALTQFAHAANVVVRHRAFELDPHARATYDAPLVELVARKHGRPVPEMVAAHDRLEREASTLGMQWHLATARPSNTFDAHRLIALGGDQGAGQATVERLYRAYFVESELLSDPLTLARLGNELGLRDVEEMLASDLYAADVRSDEADALELGISGVPAVLIDQRFLVNGAQGDAAFLSALERAWARRQVA